MSARFLALCVRPADGPGFGKHDGKVYVRNQRLKAGQPGHLSLRASKGRLCATTIYERLASEPYHFPGSYQRVLRRPWVTQPARRAISLQGTPASARGRNSCRFIHSSCCIMGPSTSTRLDPPVHRGSRWAARVPVKGADQERSVRHVSLYILRHDSLFTSRHVSLYADTSGDPGPVIDGATAAIRDGRIPREQAEAKVLRVLELKRAADLAPRGRGGPPASPRRSHVRPSGRPGRGRGRPLVDSLPAGAPAPALRRTSSPASLRAHEAAELPSGGRIRGPMSGHTRKLALAPSSSRPRSDRRDQSRTYAAALGFGLFASLSLGTPIVCGISHLGSERTTPLTDGSEPGIDYRAARRFTSAKTGGSASADTWVGISCPYGRLSESGSAAELRSHGVICGGTTWASTCTAVTHRHNHLGFRAA